MAFSANAFVIDKVRRVTQFDLETGLVDWTMTSIENPTVEFTGESVEKTDALGTLIAKFDTTKGVTFSGEGSLISAPLMAAQLGADVEVASDTETVSGKLFEVLTVSDGTATLTYEPSTTPSYCYSLTDDKNIDETIEIGADDGDATLDGTTLTLPSDFDGTSVAIMYDYETTSAVKITDSSSEFADAAGYIVDVLLADVCNVATKRAGYLVFPKAKIDNNFSIDLTTEGTHPFSFEALADYCADDQQLCYWIINE